MFSKPIQQWKHTLFDDLNWLLSKYCWLFVNVLAFIHSPLLYLSKVIDHRVIFFTGLKNDIRYINDNSLKIVFSGQGLLTQILINSWLQTKVQCDNIIYITQNAPQNHTFLCFVLHSFEKQISQVTPFTVHTLWKPISGVSKQIPTKWKRE